MEITICGGGTMTLEDDTLATFADKKGQIIAILTVSGDCWRNDRDARATLDSDTEAHVEYETTVTFVPAACDIKEPSKAQATRICRDLSGNVIRCPPR